MTDAEARRAAIVEVFDAIERLRFAPHPSRACVDYGDLMALRERLLKNSGEVESEHIKAQAKV